MGSIPDEKTKSVFSHMFLAFSADTMSPIPSSIAVTIAEVRKGRRVPDGYTFTSNKKIMSILYWSTTLENMCMPWGTKTVDKTVYKARLQINTDKRHDYAKRQ